MNRTFLFGALVLLASAAQAQVPPSLPFEALAPHRAVYEMQLLHAADGSAIRDADGRLVYELTGSGCEGFVMNSRMVLRTELAEGGSTLNDFQSSTFENALEDSFHFIAKDFTDSRLAEETNGMADREGDGIAVRLTAPEARSLNIDSGALFPVQHMAALIAAARNGERLFSAVLYDGTEGGEKTYATTAVIGDPIQGEAADGGAEADSLAGLTRWPVALSYFEQDATDADGAQVPLYEMRFELVENGVARDLVLDYGDFALKGELASLDLVPAARCP